MTWWRLLFHLLCINSSGQSNHQSISLVAIHARQLLHNSVTQIEIVLFIQESVDDASHFLPRPCIYRYKYITCLVMMMIMIIIMKRVCSIYSWRCLCWGWRHECDKQCLHFRVMLTELASSKDKPTPMILKGDEGNELKGKSGFFVNFAHDTTIKLIKHQNCAGACFFASCFDCGKTVSFLFFIVVEKKTHRAVILHWISGLKLQSSQFKRSKLRS